MTKFKTVYKNNRIYKVPIVNNKGRKHSEEQNRKHSIFMTGRFLSQESKDKISKANKGRKPYKITQETRNKMSLSATGKKRGSPSLETREKISAAQKGKPRPNKITETQRKKISEAKKGSKTHLWKGGISKHTRTQRANIMSSFEYKLWRTAVFERDKYTCVWCGHKGYVEADHIKPFALFPELRFAIDNGRTLCRPCHVTTFKKKTYE